MPLSFLRGAKRLRWRETDRLLALALTIYESWLCPGCGEDMRISMDYRLEDHWAVAHTTRCQGCTTLAEAQEADQRDGKRHPQALRHALGLRHGWEAIVSGEA